MVLPIPYKFPMFVVQANFVLKKQIVIGMLKYMEDLLTLVRFLLTLPTK